MKLFGIFLVLVLLCGHGCTARPDIFPEATKAKINHSLTFAMLLQEPDRHEGEMVLLGGEVLSARRLAQGTRLEILQLPLDSSEEPVQDKTSSQGRFFVVESSFLDPATLPPDTRVTLVGEVTGATNASLDEMEYRYPTLAMKHLHVWPESEFEQSESSGPSFGIFGGGGSGGRVGGGVSIGIGF